MAKREGEQGGRPRTCRTMDEHRRLAALSPEYRRRRREIEADTKAYIARYRADGLRTGVVRIPVVVHVVWHTAAQNVSDAQIHSQIAVLNADFRRTNADACRPAAAVRSARGCSRSTCASSTPRTSRWAASGSSSRRRPG